MANFCGKCGSAIQPGNSFCSNCGNAVADNGMAGNNIVVKKNSKNKIIGLSVCGVALILAVVIVASMFKGVGGNSYEEVAQKYAIAVVQSNIDDASECLLYDLEDVLDYDDYDEYNNGLDVNATVVESYELEEDKILQLAQEISYELDDYGLDFEDCVNLNKIKKAYRVKVKVSVYEPEDDEYWPDEVFTYTIVKYKGEWKALTNFVSDTDKLYEVW